MRVGGKLRAASAKAAARLARAEGGLTVVEVIVAGMIMVVGGLGVLGMVNASTRNTFRAEQSQVVSNVLQREMEAIKERPYEEIALMTLPVQEGGENDPNSRIGSDSAFDVDRSQAAQDLMPMVSGGTVAPGPTSFAVEDVSGTVYRYVVWDDCPEAWQCEEGELMKRVIVAVKLASTAPGGVNRRYQELQGQIADPETEPAVNPGPPPGGGDAVQWRLYLTDTPCDQPERKEHPDANGSHPTHNTRGDCADGPQQGNTPGAPDLLWPAATKLDPEKVFEYDYATDVNPQPDEDQGLQLLPGGECDSAAMTNLAIGAAVEPDVDEKAFQRVHRWLSPPIPGEPSDESVLLTGSDTSLYLWTRTVGEVPYQGRVCAWLFVRSYGGTSITDTLALSIGPPLSTHFAHFTTTWPHSGWDEIRLPLNFEADGGGQMELPPGSRLGLALSVGADTPTGLQFVYDEPSFDSRLEMTTTGALPPGAETEPPEAP